MYFFIDSPRLPELMDQEYGFALRKRVSPVIFT